MMPKVSDEAVAAYDAVAAGLEGAGVVRGSMFGMPCLKIGKKVLAGMYGDAMTFKLPPEPREKALAVPGAEQFDPGMGRPMKEWVRIPLDQSGVWPDYAAEALEYVDR
ncbi:MULTISPECIES: hypothetical protein [Kribbella]|jgi:hypothetical protein|uniref:TfoX N-terminal domain-containing protein n=1 Tax=Kribbella pratensis TaxID=2512112 RepID=A0ABY2F5E3_9ACTN|nr:MULTISPECIES: hypothetical protein [Kribbella]TDO56211.1 hypothetical protein EV651_113237 [Kribbella sp. VKM Ac-2571]TDW81769.1 hypothetical protein EV137_7779 [Kribbella pratensis]TDW83410.1 hypothetical protein EV647_7117 [Kribbella sp. VKM Ac-2566]